MSIANILELMFCRSCIHFYYHYYYFFGKTKCIQNADVWQESQSTHYSFSMLIFKPRALQNQTNYRKKRGVMYLRGKEITGAVQLRIVKLGILGHCK